MQNSGVSIVGVGCGCALGEATAGELIIQRVNDGQIPTLKGVGVVALGGNCNVLLRVIAAYEQFVADIALVVEIGVGGIGGVTVISHLCQSGNKLIHSHLTNVGAQMLDGGACGNVIRLIVTNDLVGFGNEYCVQVDLAAVYHFLADDLGGNVVFVILVFGSDLLQLAAVSLNNLPMVELVTGACYLGKDGELIGLLIVVLQAAQFCHVAADGLVKNLAGFKHNVKNAGFAKNNAAQGLKKACLCVNSGIGLLDGVAVICILNINNTITKLGGYGNRNACTVRNVNGYAALHFYGLGSSGVFQNNRAGLGIKGEHQGFGGIACHNGGCRNAREHKNESKQQYRSLCKRFFCHFH